LGLLLLEPILIYEVLDRRLEHHLLGTCCVRVLPGPQPIELASHELEQLYILINTLALLSHRSGPVSIHLLWVGPFLVRSGHSLFLNFLISFKWFRVRLFDAVKRLRVDREILNMIHVEARQLELV